MKKYILILIITVIWNSAAFAWNDCPMGEVNDPYPGKCALYTDTDNDSICDYSQPAPDERDSTKNDSTKNETISQTSSDQTQKAETVKLSPETQDLITGKELFSKTVSEVAKIYGIDVEIYTKMLSTYYGITINKNQSFQYLYENYDVKPNIPKVIASSLKLGDDIVVTEEEVITPSRVYHLIPILIVSIILYLVTLFLAKWQIISKITHRRIWNILLLIAFLVSGILGILLVIRINFAIPINLPFNILFWHVEAGIAMAIISFFHAFWHWNDYKYIFKRKRKNEESCEKQLDSQFQ